jgi:hypothetical protein
MCAVTCCLLEAVLSCALVHHAATSSHGVSHIGYLDIKDTKSKYVCYPNVLHKDIYDYVCQAAGGFDDPTSSCID